MICLYTLSLLFCRFYPSCITINDCVFSIPSINCIFPKRTLLNSSTSLTRTIATRSVPPETMSTLSINQSFLSSFARSYWVLCFCFKFCRFAEMSTYATKFLSSFLLSVSIVYFFITPSFLNLFILLCTVVIGKFTFFAMFLVVQSLCSLSISNTLLSFSSIIACMVEQVFHFLYKTCSFLQYFPDFLG